MVTTTLTSREFNRDIGRAKEWRVPGKGPACTRRGAASPRRLDEVA